MWLLNSDLHDLHIVFIRFRFDPKYPKNKEIAERIKFLIDAPQIGNCIELNRIRRELSKIEGLDGENWSWVFTEDIYKYSEKHITDDASLKIFSVGFGELIKAFESGDLSRVYYLADALHNVPALLAGKREDYAVKVILSEIGYYRKNYDSDFLKDILGK